MSKPHRKVPRYSEHEWLLLKQRNGYAMQLHERFKVGTPVKVEAVPLKPEVDGLPNDAAGPGLHISYGV